MSILGYINLSLSLYVYIISFFFFIAWHYQNSRATITTIRLPNFKCSRLENKTDGLVSPNEINTHVSHALTNLIFGHNQREELSFNSSTTNIFFKSLNRKNDFFFFFSILQTKKSSKEVEKSFYKMMPSSRNWSAGRRQPNYPSSFLIKIWFFLWNIINVHIKDNLSDAI